jgi:hypothetical protein
MPSTNAVPTAIATVMGIVIDLDFFSGFVASVLLATPPGTEPEPLTGAPELPSSLSTFAASALAEIT